MRLILLGIFSRDNEKIHDSFDYFFNCYCYQQYSLFDTITTVNQRHLVFLLIIIFLLWYLVVWVLGTGWPYYVIGGIPGYKYNGVLIYCYITGTLTGYYQGCALCWQVYQVCRSIPRYRCSICHRMRTLYTRWCDDDWRLTMTLHVAHNLFVIACTRYVLLITLHIDFWISYIGQMSVGTIVGR